MPCEPAFRITCRGTRGSIPSPGPATARYGGNTSCVEVVTPGGRLILDGGTGIRPLGRDLVARGEPVDALLLLTHFHWDHVQGIPFFEPLYQTSTRLRIVSARQAPLEPSRLFATLTERSFFPAPAEAIAARIEFGCIDEPLELPGGVEVAAFPVRHGSGAVGYRIRCGGAAVAYLPDDELSGGKYDVGPGWRDRLIEFLGGADMLLHDATYTDAEYPRCSGWGHSTVTQTIELAKEAGLRRLLLFHHAPERSDAALDAIVAGAREELAAAGSTLQVEAAAEGVELAIDG